DPVTAPDGGEETALRVKPRRAVAGEVGIFPQHVGAREGRVATDRHLDRGGEPAEAPPVALVVEGGGHGDVHIPRDVMHPELVEAGAKGRGGSQEIAARAGLDERYVREWLCALAAGGVFEYDAASRTFSLPPEHAVCLTGTSSRNLAASSQGLPMLAARLPRI